MSAVENGLSWPHWSMEKPATTVGAVASHPAHAVKPQMPSPSDCREGEGDELEAEKRRKGGMMITEGGG